MSKRRYCQHCGDFVSKSLFYEHQRNYSWDAKFEFTPEESVKEFEFQPNNISESQAANGPTVHTDHLLPDQQDDYMYVGIGEDAENDYGNFYVHQ